MDLNLKCKIVMILDFAVLLGHLTYDHPSSQCQKMFFLKFNVLWCNGEEQNALWRRVVIVEFKVWHHLGELVLCRGLEAKWCESVEEY